MKNKLIVLLAVCLCLAVCFAACKKDDKEPEKTAEVTTVAPDKDTDGTKKPEDSEKGGESEVTTEPGTADVKDPEDDGYDKLIPLPPVER